MFPRFRRAYASLAELAEREAWSRTQIETHQLGRLNDLWRHAVRHVAYYRELARTSDLPPHFHDLEEFRTLVPILSKPFVRANGHRLLSEKPRPGEWKYTSGSTGAPTPVYRARDAHLAMLRSRYRFYQMWGADFLDRWVFIWGNAESFAPGLAGWKARFTTPVKDWLRNRIRLSPYDLRKERLQRHLARIASYRPAAVYSHSMAAYLLAAEAEQMGFQCRSLKLVVLTAEPVRPCSVEAVQRAMGVPAVNEYGSIECGFLAGEWPDRTLRVREDDVLLETVPRQDGCYDIVVTVLGNPSCPLIRYAIGDVTDRPLTFPEQGFAILHNVSGRDYDLVVTRSGGILHGQVFEDILDKYPDIRRWRLVQGADGAIAILIECVRPVPPQTLRFLERRFRDLVESYDVALEIVDNMPSTPSGKHRAILSEMGASAASGNALPVGSGAD